MGELSERLDRLAVQTWSPDGNICAEARGEYQISVRFAAGTYRTYTESTLGQQLGRLGALVWTRYRREYTEIMETFLEEEPLPREDPEDRRFRERLEQLHLAGASADGRIGIRSRALVHWELTIAPGTLRALTEPEFLAQLDGAVREVVADYRARLILLTHEVYDIGLPRSPAAGQPAGPTDGAQARAR